MDTMIGLAWYPSPPQTPLLQAWKEAPDRYDNDCTKTTTAVALDTRKSCVTHNVTAASTAGSGARPCRHANKPTTTIQQ